MSLRPIHTCQQARDLDRLVIEQFGIPGYELMSRAGCGAFKVLQKYWPQCRKIAVLCGRGNNGGDGYILASAALNAGICTNVFCLGQPTTSDSESAYNEFCQLGGTVETIHESIAFEMYDVVVDALFGSGLGRNIEGQLRQLLRNVNARGKAVLSLDIPSGLGGDTGEVRGEALQADVTVTFMSTKLGLVTDSGKDHRGILELDTLQIPSAAYDQVAEVATLIDTETLAARKLKRKASTHKGSVGHVLIVGGNNTMQGAALMAGQAACRAGAGLVSIATISGSAELITASAPQIRGFPVDNSTDLLDLLESCDVTGVGPGLGQDAWANRVWESVQQVTIRLVVDADALNLLAKKPQRRVDWILTPHPGEAGRLLSCSTREVQEDRISAAHAIVDRYGGICVLKGSGTIVAGGQRTWICDRGNPGMAAGGMGDVLTGVISALWAQGLTAEEAACLGVWLHACAGDDSANQAGEIGMIATDLLPGIRSNLARIIERAVTTKTR